MEFRSFVVRVRPFVFVLRGKFCRQMMLYIFFKIRERDTSARVTMSVTLERLVLNDFKSFRGRVEIPIDNHNKNGSGSLVCVVGPNGSGKSTISDALTFCFGEKDMRAKSLGALINEEAAADGIATASVAVDIQNSDNGAVLRVARSVTVFYGKATSEYSIETLAPGGSSTEGILSHRPESISRSKLIDRLRSIDINLNVVDSFICKQQGSTLASLSGLAMLQFIESLVGTSALASEIEACSKTATNETDAAIAFEVAESSVRQERRTLAPARAAFENYRLEHSEFVHDLAAFAEKEKRLYAHQRAAADDAYESAAMKLAKAQEHAQPAAAAAAEAKSELAAAQKAASKVHTLERNHTRAVADEEEKLETAKAEEKLKNRQLSAAEKRAALAVSEAEAADAAHILANDEALASSVPFDKATESLAEARQELENLVSRCSNARSSALRQKQLLRLNAKLRANAASRSRATIEQDDKVTQLKKLREAENSAAHQTTLLRDTMDIISKRLQESRLKQEAAAEAVAHASAFEQTAQRELALARAETRRCASELGRKRAGGASKATSDSLRRTVSQLISRLVSSNDSGIQQAPTIHGWLNELAWAQEGYSISLNAVLKSSLANVVVVQSRSDAIQLIDACRHANVGPITCDVLDEIPNRERQEADSRSSNLRVGRIDLQALIEFLDFTDDRYRPVFAARLQNWFLVADEAASLAAMKSTPEVRGEAPNIVTLSGDMFLGDGELRTDARASKVRNVPACSPCDLRVRGNDAVNQNSAASLVSADEQQVLPGPVHTNKDPAEALKDAEKREAVAANSAAEANSKRWEKEKELRQCKESTSTIAAEVHSKEEEAFRMDVIAKNATKKVKSKQAELQAAELLVEDAIKEEESARVALTSAAKDSDDNNVDSWLLQLDACCCAIDCAERDIASAESGRRSSAAAQKRAEKSALRSTRKVAYCNENVASATSNYAAAVDAVSKVNTRLKERLTVLEDTKKKLSAPLAEVESCQERLLEKEQEADQNRDELESALRMHREAAASSKSLDAWFKAIEARDAEIAAQMPSKSDFNCRRKKDDDYDDLTESSDSEDEVPLNLNRKKKEGIALTEKISDKGTDNDPQERQKGTPEEAASRKSSAKLQRNKYRFIKDVDAYKEQLDVARAGLRLRQAVLQKSEDSVDISAVEQDLELAAKEESLQADR